MAKLPAENLPPQTEETQDKKLTKKPSAFNKEAAIGFLPGVAVALFSPTAIIIGIGLALALIGAIIGGVKGKTSQEEKNRNPDAPPKRPRSMWNKDALLGGLIGLVAARPLTMGTANMLTSEFIKNAGNVIQASNTAIGIGVTGAMLVGVYLGGRYGQSCEETEYEQFLRKQMANMLGSSIAPEVVPLLVSTWQQQQEPPERNYSEQIRREQMQKKTEQPEIYH